MLKEGIRQIYMYILDTDTSLGDYVFETGYRNRGEKRDRETEAELEKRKVRVSLSTIPIVSIDIEIDRIGEEENGGGNKKVERDGGQESYRRKERVNQVMLSDR